MAIAPAPPASTAGPIFARHPEYADLKRQVRHAGLLDQRPGYYTLKIAVSLALYAAAVAAAFLLSGWWSLLAAAPVGVMLTQVGLIGHDLAHRQVWRGRRSVTITSILLGNLLIGVSYTWWSRKHNAHHANPNQEEADPDIDFPVMAFSAAQVEDRRHGPWRWVIAYQAYFLWALASLQALSMQVWSWLHLLREQAPHRPWQLLALAGFCAGYGVLLWSLGWPVAFAFFVIQVGVSGIYNVMVFAPNHKGLPVLDADSDLDFLHRQIVTSRTVRSHPVTDLVYGGLNYQIEHHLFPTMPRCNLRRAQPIVRAFCHQHDLPYVEDSPAGALRAILSHLHEVSAPLRRPAAP